MTTMTRACLILLVVLVLAVPAVIAAGGMDGLGDVLAGDAKEPPTVKIVNEGSSAISSSLASKSTGEKSAILATATDMVLKEVKYPYAVEGTEITILKYRCSSEMCGYWITATRGGKEVATNSPVWISPPPYQAIVSDVLDEKENIETITLKEDPKAAAEQILQEYVDRQPLGKAITGTKE